VREREQKVTLVGGEVLTNVHRASDCHPKPCPIHRPTDHHMVTWPQHYRHRIERKIFFRGQWVTLPGDYRNIMERICSHGVGHPDPDDLRIRMGYDDGSHSCDMCCVTPCEIP
jgi:hypothetical protein